MAVVEPDIFSTALPMQGTFFTVEGEVSSGLYNDVRKLDRWTYEHFPSGYYSIPLWERATIVGSGRLSGTPHEISWRLRERLDVLGRSRDLRKGAYGCIGRNDGGYYVTVYCFDDEHDARRFAEEEGGRWIIAIMTGWVSMY